MKEIKGDVKKNKSGGSSNICVGLGLFVLLYMSAAISVGTLSRVVCGHDCFYSLMTPSDNDGDDVMDCSSEGEEGEENSQKKNKLFRFLSSKQTQPSTETLPEMRTDKCDSSICLFCTNLLAAVISPYSLPAPLLHTAHLTNNKQCTSTKHEAADEEAKQKHKAKPAGPVRHIIDQAAAFFKLRKQKKNKQLQQKQSSSSISQQQQHIANLWGPDAITPSNTLTYSQTEQSMMNKLSSRVLQTFSNDSNEYTARMQRVYWGSGEASSFSHATSNNPSFPWWFPDSNDAHAKPNKHYTAVTALPASMEGSSLMAAYMKIMEWPKNMKSTFPYKLCSKGCDAEFSVQHTLEFREKYKPWCVSPSLIQENSIGWIYHRGHARSEYDNNDNNNEKKNDLGGHAMIWYRPGLYQVRNAEFYTRNLMHSLDAAVAESLQRTHGTIGKYNIVLDCNNFSFAMMPRIHDVKRGMVMMQDHFPDRLGVLLLANLSGPAQLFLKVITPFITEKVRNKIHALPNDPQQRIESLKVLIDEEHIPDWLGGEDTYRFDKKDWFENAVKCTDEEALEYLTTMPYHA